MNTENLVLVESKLGTEIKAEKFGIMNKLRNFVVFFKGKQQGSEYTYLKDAQKRRDSILIANKLK